MAKTFSKRRCIQGCQQLADAHDRARCCADCLALHLARMNAETRRRADATKQATKTRPTATPARRGRRYAMLFGSSAPAASGPATAPARPKARASLGGVPPLRDAEDRRDARAIAAGIASSGVLICNALYPEAGEEEGAAARRRAREQCAAAIQALHASATGIIDAATRDRSGAQSAAEIEAALEEMRLHVEGVQDQAEARDREKAAARQREEEDRRREEDDQRNRNLLIGGGIVALIAAAGVGYVVLRDDDEAA